MPARRRGPGERARAPHGGAALKQAGRSLDDGAHRPTPGGRAPARVKRTENVMPELTLELRAAAGSDDVEAIVAHIEAGAIRTRRTLRAIPRSTPPPTGARLEPSGPCSEHRALAPSENPIEHRRFAPIDGETMGTTNLEHPRCEPAPVPSRDPLGGVLAALLVAIHPGRRQREVANVAGQARPGLAIARAQSRSGRATAPRAENARHARRPAK